MTTTQHKNNRELSAHGKTGATALSATFIAHDPRNNSEIGVKSWKHANIAWIDTDTTERRQAADIFCKQHAAEIADVQDFGDYIEVYRNRK